MRAVILAGGKGTRLAPYTNVLPKPLMPVGDMPILEIVISQLQRRGITQITLAVGHLAMLLETFFGDGSRYGVQIDYAFEDHPLGTAGPLALIPGLDEPFIVMNGDVLTTLDFAALMGYHRLQRASATIAMHRREVKIDLGVIEMNGGNRIKGYIEKPRYDYRVSMGIYCFEPSVIPYIPAGEYFDFPDLIHRLLESRERVVGYPYDGYWLDIGRPDDYAQAVQDFESMRPEFLMEQADELEDSSR